MSGKTAFAVPKDRQQVVVRMSKDVLLEGEIFLESLSEGQSMHQKIVNFLENDTAFFPLKVAPAGNTEFIHKSNIQSVSISLPDDPDITYFSGLLLHTIPLAITLPEGDTISGHLMAEVPREKARLSDCLNLPDAFLSIRSQDTVFYINKNAIRKAVHA